MRRPDAYHVPWQVLVRVVRFAGLVAAAVILAYLGARAAAAHWSAWSAAFSR